MVRFALSGCLLACLGAAFVGCEGRSTRLNAESSSDGGVSLGGGAFAGDPAGGAPGAATGGNDDVGASGGGASGGGGFGSAGDGGEPGASGSAMTDGGAVGEGGSAQAGNGGFSGGAGAAIGGGAGSSSAGTAGNSGTAGSAGTGGSAGCGGYDQPCCLDQCTEPDAVCAQVDPMLSERRCLRCGVPGTPCCDGPNARDYRPYRCDGGCCVFQSTHPSHWSCIATGDVCPVGGACEADGACAECGRIGQACCARTGPEPSPPAWCPTPSTTCIYEALRTCEPCGEAGQRCCYETETAFPVGACRMPLRCEDEVCE
jgi:hypothetical protein